MSELRFYKEKKTKSVVRVVKGDLVLPESDFELLIEKSADASTEKHVPVVRATKDSVDVTVGSTLHPMTDEHYIQFIYLETERGGQIKYLAPGEKPHATFALKDDKLLRVYEYCNIHGLWVYEI